MAAFGTRPGCVLRTPWLRRYSEDASDVFEFDGGQGRFPAGVAFPQVTDLAALDEFGGNRRNHPIAAQRAAHGAGKGTHRGKRRRFVLKLHGLGPSRLRPPRLG
jgi:hypothetical protein